MDSKQYEKNRIIIIIIKFSQSKINPKTNELIPFHNRYIIIAKKLPKEEQ